MTCECFRTIAESHPIPSRLASSYRIASHPISSHRGACDRRRASSTTMLYTSSSGSLPGREPGRGVRESRSPDGQGSRGSRTHRTSRSSSRGHSSSGVRGGKERYISSGSRFYANLVMSRNSTSCGTFSEALQSSTEIDFTGVQSPPLRARRTSSSGQPGAASGGRVSRTGSGGQQVAPSDSEEQVRKGRCSRGRGGGGRGGCSKWSAGHIRGETRV